VPKDVRGDFLSLRGLGSLLGKTKSVDMPFTRKKGIVRILIFCVDPESIPPFLDIWIKGGFYRLKFLVEGSIVPLDHDGPTTNSNGRHNGDDDANKGYQDGTQAISRRIEIQIKIIQRKTFLRKHVGVLYYQEGYKRQRCHHLLGSTQALFSFI
jgi:hypothetical protein